MALVWVVAGSQELCCSDRFQHCNHGGYVVSRIAGAKRLPSQTKFKNNRARLFVNAALEVSSSNLTSESASRTTRFPDLAGLVTDSSGRPMLPSEKKVYDVVLKQAALVKKGEESRLLDVKPDSVPTGRLQILDEAYERCREVCAEYAKTFYLGTLLMTPERQKAIWAIYVWCRRTDELVDGPNASHTTPNALDRWEQRLHDLFNGSPYDMLDAALAHTVARYPVDIQVITWPICNQY